MPNETSEYISPPEGMAWVNGGLVVMQPVPTGPLYADEQSGESPPLPLNGKPKILIGVPGFAGIVPEAQESFARMIFRCGRDLPQYDFALEIVVKREQFRARNQLVDAAIASGCDYLLMLDDDMIVPPDLVARLLAHDKDVIGALYWQRGGAFHPVLMHAAQQPTGEFIARFYAPFDPVITQPGLHAVDVIGGGCMLFKVDIFRKLTPPYFWWEDRLGTDIAICTRLKDAGVQIWVDTSIELGHMSDRQVVTGKSIPLATQAMGEVQEQLWEDAIAYLGFHSSELESCMTRAAHHTQRQKYWAMAPRDTWEGVRDFYTSFGEWHVCNLLFWAMSKRDQMAEWLLTQSDRLLPRGSHILDLGPGIGMLTVAMAQKGHQLLAMDLEGVVTLDFLRWRRMKRALQKDSLIIKTFTTPAPESNLLVPVDCALLLSMIEHCWAPYDTLAWTIRQLRPGGLLLCDYRHAEHREEEPQHLLRYDPTTLGQWLYEHGMEQAPEFYWLWKKRG